MELVELVEPITVPSRYTLIKEVFLSVFMTIVVKNIILVLYDEAKVVSNIVVSDVVVKSLVRCVYSYTNGNVVQSILYDYIRNTLVFCYNKGMSNNIVQLTDYNDNNIYPIAGAAAEGSITKTMLDEGVFVGAELSDPGNIAYVGTADIQDSAVTTAKIADLNVTTAKLATGAVTSDKIDWTTQTIDLTSLAPAQSERVYATVRGKFVILGVANLRLGGSGDYTEVIQLPSNLYPDKEYCAGAAALNSNYQPVGAATVTIGTNGQVRFRVNSANAAIVRGQICYYTA